MRIMVVVGAAVELYPAKLNNQGPNPGGGSRTCTCGGIHPGRVERASPIELAASRIDVKGSARQGWVVD